jgi:hypothetical protein
LELFDLAKSITTYFLTVPNITVQTGGGGGSGGNTPGGGETEPGTEGEGENPDTAPGDGETEPETGGQDENSNTTESQEQIEVGKLPESGIISVAPITLLLYNGTPIVDPAIPAGDPGKAALEGIGVAIAIENGALTLSGQAVKVGDFTVTVEGIDSDGKHVTKDYVVRIEPYDVLDASGVVTDNPRQNVTTTLTGSPSSPNVTITLQSDVPQADAISAMSYSGTKFAVSGTGNGVQITGGRFLLSGIANVRGANGDGVPLEITGTTSGADLSGAKLDTVTYVAGIKRYTQNVNVRLAETKVIDNTNPKSENGGADGNGGGGCDAGMAGMAIVAAAVLALSRRGRRDS